MKKEELINLIKNGATIYDLEIARELRKLKQEEPQLLIIIDDIEELEKILNIKFGTKDRIPYFGAIATQKRFCNY